MSNWLNRTLLIMAIITFLLIAVFFYFQYQSTDAASQAVNIDEIVENRLVKTEELTTNLKDNAYISVQFKIQVSGEEAKTELEKRIFQVKNTIIYLLSGKEAKDLRGQEGIKQLETALQKRINDYLKTGKVVKVYTIKKMIQ